MEYDFIMGFITGIMIVYVVALALYLNAEKKNDGTNGFKAATIRKLILSIFFCLVGILSYNLLLNYSHFSDIYFNMQFLILLGLLAAIAGDFFLQYIKKDTKKYKIGIACFVLTQVLFIVSMVIMNILDVKGWLISLIITVVVLLCVNLLMKKQQWKLGSEKKIVTVYTVLLTFMMARSIAGLVHDMTVGTLFMAVGAVLFVVSDLFLGIWNYKTGKRIHANLNWITYFAGMLLIALSINPVFSQSLIYG